MTDHNRLRALELLDVVPAVGDLVGCQSVGVLGVTSIGSNGKFLGSNGTTFSWMTLPTIAPTAGGTGITTYGTGDTLYASAANTLSKLTTSGTAGGWIYNLSGGVPVWTNRTSQVIPQAAVGTGLVSKAGSSSASNFAVDDHVHPMVTPHVTLTDAATIAIDASLGLVFDVTLGGNRTLGAPTNPVDGQKIVIRVRQDGTGSRTLAYNAIYRFNTTVASPTLSTGPNKTDILGFIYNAADTKWDAVGVVLS